MSHLLSIIIVNYRSADLITDCLLSVARYNPDLGAEVIIVDNASGDDSRERLEKGLAASSRSDAPSLPSARSAPLLPPIWIDMGYNAGFARANNAGMRAARGSVFLLLNPDTLAIDDSISRCHRRFLESDYAACGVQQLNADRTPQISGNFFMKGGLNHLLPLPYWGSFLRSLAFGAGTKAPHIAEATGVEEVDWISGAFLMVKRSAVDVAGMMDDDFFLYAEEVEWCSRLKRVGALCIFGQERIIHLQGEAVQKDQGDSAKGYAGLFTRKDLQLMVSNHLRVRKQFGVGWFLFLLLNYSFGVIVFWVGGFFHRLFTLRNPFGDFGRAAQFTRNIAVIWGLAPTIIRNKPHFYKML
jgi:GT2 family glycosyltransferase